jgi:hypothetical protein
MAIRAGENAIAAARSQIQDRSLQDRSKTVREAAMESVRKLDAHINKRSSTSANKRGSKRLRRD